MASFVLTLCIYISNIYIQYIYIYTEINSTVYNFSLIKRDCSFSNTYKYKESFGALLKSYLN